MAFNQLSTFQPGLQDLQHTLTAIQHPVHVHHFRYAAHFRPAEQGIHLFARKVCA